MSDEAKAEARRRLLTPLSDEEAKALRLITREEIEAVLRQADAELRAIERTNMGRCSWPQGRYR